MDQKAIHVEGLSSKLMTMKFMKRGEIKSRKTEETPVNKLNQDEFWQLEYPSEQLEKLGFASAEKPKMKTKSVQSYFRLSQENGSQTLAQKDVADNSRQIGRKSFKQFNTKVEKIESEIQEIAKQEIREKELKEISTSDAEMSKFYSKKRFKSS
ncbi:hypothetical protein BB560_003143 [Smittium megazygosporum]|uniref:Uncharacterized protein n=1 Tax=Smittium megazygosporum TaxID=133381 RepID=A0A2T9ZCV9_9FUNG|nr:hypothetical protein BB560_003143 [Smittium megazygosporum]